MRFVQALFDMFVFFAIVHILITILLAIKNLDFSYINVFYIESASELFPGLDKGIGSLILSGVIIAVVYSLFFARRKQ